MNRWVPLRGELTVGDDEPRTVFTATAIDGWEPAFHPMFDTRGECVELCNALNELGWTEDQYFDNARAVTEAIDNGTLPRLIAKRTARGFWRGVLLGLGWRK